MFPQPQLRSVGTLRSSDLLRMKREEVVEIFRQSKVPQSPRGFFRGAIIAYPGTPRAIALSKTARALWQGKTFVREGLIRNRWFGIDMIEGRSYIGDGRIERKNWTMED